MLCVIPEKVLSFTTYNQFQGWRYVTVLIGDLQVVTPENHTRYVVWRDVYGIPAM